MRIFDWEKISVPIILIPARLPNRKVKFSYIFLQELPREKIQTSLACFASNDLFMINFYTEKRYFIILITRVEKRLIKRNLSGMGSAAVDTWMAIQPRIYQWQTEQEVEKNSGDFRFQSPGSRGRQYLVKERSICNNALNLMFINSSWRKRLQYRFSNINIYFRFLPIKVRLQLCPQFSFLTCKISRVNVYDQKVSNIF